MGELPTGTVTFLFTDIEGFGLVVTSRKATSRYLGNLLAPDTSTRPELGRPSVPRHERLEW
jgi:hypothetical protein